MVYGATQKGQDDTLLSSVIVPGNINPIPIQGGYQITDSNDNVLAQVLLSLGTTIAGEDIPNDRLKTSNEVVMSNTNTHNAVSILNGSQGTTNNAVYSNPINSANYRKYAIAGWGANGNIQLLLQVSYDAGNTWLWHVNGFVNAGQFIMQQGDIIAPLARLVAINVSGSTQSVTAYLCLAR